MRDWLAAAAEEHPDRLAVEAGDGRLTYGELHARADELARRLDVAPGRARAGRRQARASAFAVLLHALPRRGAALEPLPADRPAPGAAARRAVGRRAAPRPPCRGGSHGDRDLGNDRGAEARRADPPQPRGERGRGGRRRRRRARRPLALPAAAPPRGRAQHPRALGDPRHDGRAARALRPGAGARAARARRGHARLARADDARAPARRRPRGRPRACARSRSAAGPSRPACSSGRRERASRSRPSTG